MGLNEIAIVNAGSSHRDRWNLLSVDKHHEISFCRSKPLLELSFTFAIHSAQFVKWEVYREGERVADGLSFTVYRTGRSPSAKATCVGEATTFRERLFP